MDYVPSSAPTLKAQIASLVQGHQKVDGLYPHIQTNQHNPRIQVNQYAASVHYKHMEKQKEII